MPPFDDTRYTALMEGAVGLDGDIDKAVNRAIAEGCDVVMFLGSGGAGILMEPALQLLHRRSGVFALRESTAEVVLTGSPHLHDRTLVVMPSLSGTTPETLAALAAAQSAGARVIALTGTADSPLAKTAEHVIVNPAADDTSSESFFIQSLLVALSVMQARGEIADRASIVGEMAALPAALLHTKGEMAERAVAFAQTLAASDWHIFTGAGPAWFEALYFGTCILEEMQWIRTRPIHASDFFHGTLELLEPGVSVFLLVGEDECRPLAERIARFVPAQGGALTRLDTADFALPNLSRRLRALFGPAILACALQCVAEELALLRDHPLATRRYYRRIAY